MSRGTPCRRSQILTEEILPNLVLFLLRDGDICAPSGLQAGVPMFESRSKNKRPSWRACLEGELLLMDLLLLGLLLLLLQDELLLLLRMQSLRLLLLVPLLGEALQLCHAFLVFQLED